MSSAVSNDVKKMVTLYVSSALYQDFQNQAKKSGKNTAELIRAAMEEYSKNNFHQKQKLSSLDFSAGVKLKSGAGDFLTDSWREDFLDCCLDDCPDDCLDNCPDDCHIDCPTDCPIDCLNENLDRGADN